MAKARSALVLEKIFRRATENREAFDEFWTEMEGLEGDGTERIEERRKGKLPTRVPLYANRLDKLEDALKREVRKMNALKDELTKWLQENPRSDSDRRERAEEWIKIIVDKIHGFHRNFRETKIRKIVAPDESECERVGVSRESMGDFLDKSVEDLKVLLERIEVDAQEAETRAKGKREKKQIKEREEKRQRYIEYHLEQLALLHRMLNVSKLSPEQISDLEDMVSGVMGRQGRTPDDGFEEEEQQYEVLTDGVDLGEIEALEAEAVQRAKERKKEERAAQLQQQKEEQRRDAANEEKRTNRVRTIAPSSEQPAKQQRERDAKQASQATPKANGAKPRETNEPMRHPCLHQNGHCSAGDGCQYAMYEASVCVMQLRFGACRGSKDGRCIWDHPRNPKPLPLQSNANGSGVVASAPAIASASSNVWGNTKVVMAAIGADTPKPAPASPSHDEADDRKRKTREADRSKEKEKEREKKDAEARERKAKEKEERARQLQEQKDRELQDQQQQQQQQLVQEKAQKEKEEKERRLKEEREKREREESAAAEAAAAAAAAAARAEEADRQRKLEEERARERAQAEAEAEEAAAVGAAAAAAIEAVAEEAREASVAAETDAESHLSQHTLFPGKWDEPQEEASASASMEPPSSCNSDRDGAPPMSDLTSLVSKSERSESRHEDLPPLEAVGANLGTLFSSFWNDDGALATMAPSEATEASVPHQDASKANGVIADGASSSWASPSWRPVSSNGLFGGKWDSRPMPQAPAVGTMPAAVSPPQDHTAELERLRKENDQLRGRSKEKDTELRACKEMVKMLQQERDSLKDRVKSLAQQMRAMRTKDEYGYGEYGGAKRDDGMFDLEWLSAEMHEDLSDDPTSRRFQQRICQAMRDATIGVLKDTRADIEAMSGGDQRHQREKKPFLKSDRYPNTKRSKLHASGMRYQQHEMMEPQQDPPGYAMDPAQMHYSSFVPAMVRGHYA